ncbi:MAG TPA: nucleotide exchange factor GrpE [Acidimicrobiales bacterium]|nr:nucleotide exchange factor GrpE [Acidimicrobiales bacterium]
MSDVNPTHVEPDDPRADAEAPAEGVARGPDDAPPADTGPTDDGPDDGPPSVEDLLASLEAVTAERDEYLALAQAKQAEFENFRKRTMKQQADDVARAAGSLVEVMLPVLDAFDYGVAHGDESLVPMRGQLLGVLEREGLERLDPVGEAFDPNEHEAVAHEAGDGGEPEVAETLRAGYRWKGRLVRPVMVRVRD